MVHVARKQGNGRTEVGKRHIHDDIFVNGRLFKIRSNQMFKKMIIVVALSAIPFYATATEADARNEAKQTIELQDGSTLYIFKSGKMAVESKVGIAVSTKPGTILKAKDGTTIKMVGNEVARLDTLLKQGEGGTGGK
jgi:hypothetical protein